MIGSLVVLVIIIVGIVWILMSRTSSIAAQVKPVTSSLEAAQRLDTKWDDFKNTVGQSQPGTPVTVTLTQEEVNSKINEELKTVTLPSGLGISDVNVNLVDGKILISANVNYSILSGSAGMEATIEMVNGNPSIVIRDVDMGKLPIPQSLKDQLKDLIPEGGVINTSGLPFDTQNVVIVDGQLIINGVTK